MIIKWLLEGNDQFAEQKKTKKSQFFVSARYEAEEAAFAVKQIEQRPTVMLFL